MVQAPILQTVGRPVPFPDSPRLFAWRGEHFLVHLLLHAFGVSDHDLTQQAVGHDRPITLQYQVTPWSQWLNTPEVSLLLLLYVHWILVGRPVPCLPYSETQAGGVVTIWKLPVAAAGGRALKCFFPDEHLSIFHWPQKDTWQDQTGREWGTTILAYTWK